MAKKATVKVVDMLADAMDSVQPKTKSKSNSEGLLFEIRKWQEAKAMAEKKLKEAWASAERSGLIPSDDDLRGYDPDTHIVAEAGAFSATVKVGAVPSAFSGDKAVALMVRRFKVSEEKAKAILDDARVDGTIRLEKRVLEV